jgi:predicted MFS family arabinose efflux permease
MAPNYTIFLVSRGLEGISFSLCAILGMTTAGIWFPPDKIGMPMGLASTCVGVGGIIANLIAPHMARVGGWQSVWWLTVGLSVVSLISVIAFVRMPPWMKAAAAEKGAPKGPGMGEAFGNRNLWLWAAGFGLMTLPMALIMYYVTYLTKVQGVPLERAGMIASLSSIGLLFGAPFGGFLVGKLGLGNMKRLIAVTALLYAILLALAFNISGPAIPIWMLLTGAIGLGCIPTLFLSTVPSTGVKPELIGIGMAIAMFAMNLFNIVGPPVFGAIVTNAGWNAAAYSLIPVVAISVGLAYMTKLAE